MMTTGSQSEARTDIDEMLAARLESLVDCSELAQPCGSIARASYVWPERLRDDAMFLLNRYLHIGFPTHRAFAVNQRP